MTFNKIIKYITKGVCLSVGLILSSCVYEDFSAENPSENTEDATYYISLNINIPTTPTSRSTTKPEDGTSSDGYLDAMAIESQVNTVTLYFFNSTTGEKLLQLSSGSDDFSISDPTEGTGAVKYKYILKSKVEVDDLRSIFGKISNIYAVANSDGLTPGTGTTDEDKFLASTFANPSPASKNYFCSVKQTSETDGTVSYGMLCPMSNVETFTLDLSRYTLTTDTDEEVIVKFMQLIGNKADFTYQIPGSLNLERMISRVDFLSQNANNVYEVPNCESNVEGCNTSTGGVKLKVNNMTLFNIAPSAYGFRHTAVLTNSESNNDDAIDQYVIEPFGKENGNTTNDEKKYIWIASNDWGSKSGFANPNGGPYTTGSNTADEIGAMTVTNYSNGGFHPWYYIMENTVPSTDDMNVDKCTGIEFEMVLYKADGTIYTTAEEDDNVRITYTSGDDQGWYAVLTPKQGTDSKYYYTLTYKFVIPHHLGSSTVPDTDTGVTTDKKPMQYGVVRNNVYQIKLTGIKKLPSPQEPDNLYLSIDIKVLAWAKRDIHVTF